MTKHNFIKIMNALEAQYKYDELHSKSLAKVLGLEEGSMYNNGSLVDCMISVMASGFNDSKRAEESIRHFMYDDGFGKENSSRSITVEDLWENLCSSFVHKQPMSEPSINKINTTQAIFLNIDKLIKMHQDNSSYNELSNIVLALKINIDVLRNFSSNSDKEFFLVDTDHKIEFEKHIPNFHYESNSSQINQLDHGDNT
jgi:hypothetical protein